MERTARISAWRVVLSALLGAGWVAGDCGSIPFVPDAKIFEPNQRALIAWNGTEELLVLSTDLSASEPTKVLEVIPLPNKPTVTAGDVRIFHRAVDLINEKLRPPQPKPRIGGGGGGGLFGEDSAGGRPTPAGRVTFHDRVGAAEVSVTRVLKPEGFVQWVEKYLKSANVKNPTIPGPLKKVVGEYLDDGFQWFVFNVVSLSTRTQSKQAVVYRFKSRCIYYPLRITRTEEGETAVKLIVLTRETIGNYSFSGLPRWRVKVPERPVTITWQEFKRIDRKLLDFMGTPPTAKLRIWEIEGALAEFEQDLFAGLPSVFYLRQNDTQKLHGPFAYIQGAKVRIGPETYSVQAGDPTQEAGADVFEMISIDRNRRYGPFELVTGKPVLLRQRPFTLVRARIRP